MLLELRISNFTLIDRINLEFSAGFHVLTGETGAGKSIMVDALALLVGGRSSVDQIRTDADEAELEAAFALTSDNSALDCLQASGIPVASDGQILIRRVLSRSGRNRIYLNGRLTPLHVLQGLAGTLVDIHGQHDQQSLLSAEAQLDALDSFGNLKELRGGYLTRYRQWQTGKQQFEAAVREAAEKGKQEEFLRFQCRELEEAALQPGEEAALMTERNRLTHVGRLVELGEEAYQALYGGDSSALSHLGLIGDRLRQLRSIDPETGMWEETCDTASLHLQETALQIRDYLHRLEQDPQRLAVVEERLDRIQRLKRKYGESIEALISRSEELRSQLQGIESSESRLADLRDRVSRDQVAVESCGGRLSQARQRAAKELESRVGEELMGLRMDATRLPIEVRRNEAEDGFTETGCDLVEFLFSANQGEPLLPLARVVSGGELSRVMLAIKAVLAKSDRVPVLVFDEIDAGIGGAVAEVMGQRLKSLTPHHQVFCVTHLPQIASQADSHFLVEKSVKNSRTVTQVKNLDRKGRKDEIARMLGGVTITNAVRETAAEMIAGAKEKH